MSKEEDPFEIPLDNEGLITWIDQQDIEVAGMGWQAKASGRKGTPAYYAWVGYKIAGVFHETYLHNLIWERMMDAPLPTGFLVDHVNKDKLDNRRSNLRLATRSENEANKRKRQGDTTSRYKGVSKIRDGRQKCWRVSITVDGTQIKVGTFYDEHDAGEAYNEAALNQWGEFAYLNTIKRKRKTRGRSKS